MDRIDFDHETPNESRADYGARIEHCTPDWGGNDLGTDIKDALADVAHYLHRCGIPPEGMFLAALESAEGDLEDGPEAVFDPSIARNHNGGRDRYEMPDPPEELADAWRRFQAGEDVPGHELRRLDEWRADAREEALGW